MKNQRNFPLAVILGPTAVGKTELSLKLAGEVNIEIISADSMQVYREMDIGTAKAGPEIREKIPHHMLDIINPEEQFSVAEYQNKVDEIIPQICNRDHLPVMVGGTGLYIRAVTEGFMLPEMEKDKQLRERLQKKAKNEGNKAVHSKLAEVDPQLAEKLHPNDLRRVIRGLEIYQQTGKTKTYFKKMQQERPPRYRVLKIGLKRPREKLYERINRRVDLMMEQGLEKEVCELYQKYDLSQTALQAVGYKELINYFTGQYDKKEAIRLIKRNTRHLAKKQLTWFKRDESIKWFDLSKLTYKQVNEKCVKLIKNRFQV
ncbi:MAG: tRNA (adenosine(37)-N6)-dimethylallyltransferase MiaA [Halanaerobiaceae bacterium]